jgi:hypothetical protein
VTTLLLAHAAATLYMAGLIWFVQVVHYPLLGRVGRGEFVAYERAHVRRTTWVVGPPMLVEAGTAVALVVVLGGRLPWIGLALLAVVWLSTALLQVPCHERLRDGFDEAVHRRLVRTNAIRAAAWTARAVIAIALVG